MKKGAVHVNDVDLFEGAMWDPSLLSLYLIAVLSQTEQ